MNLTFLNIYSGLVNRGAETVVHELATRFSKYHHVQVIQGGPPSKQSTYKQIQIPNMQIISPDPGKGLMSKIKHALFLDSYTKQVQHFTDLALSHIRQHNSQAVLSFNGPSQIQILKQFQKQFPFQLIYINQGQHHPSPYKLAGWDNFAKLHATPDDFVTLTPPMYEWSKHHANPQTRIHLIPNGVDLQKFHPDIDPEKIELPRPLILCVAGLQPYKRVHLLIQAMAQLEQGSLLVLGDGPLRSQLKQHAQQQLGSNRFQLATIDHSQMPSYYAAADLFSLPSEPLEAFGVAYLEATATNKPVVAPNDETRQFIIGNGGILTDVQNPATYASAITQALQTNWGNKPRQQAQKFDWNEIVKQYEKIFHNV